MKAAAPIQEFRDKPSKKNPANETRCCQHEDCTTVLSTYNFTYYCSLHEHIYANPKSFI
jgi:hypothetical protein